MHQGILWVVPGPPAVKEEMSRPLLQGSRSAGVKTGMLSNGQRLDRPSHMCTLSQDGMAAWMNGARSAWAYICAQVPEWHTPSGLCSWGIAPLRPLPSLLLS